VGEAKMGLDKLGGGVNMRWRKERPASLLRRGPLNHVD
jgi:hypothetical protein